MKYLSCMKDGERLWDKMAPILFNKCISNRNVNRNEFFGRSNILGTCIVVNMEIYALFISKNRNFWN